MVNIRTALVLALGIGLIACDDSGETPPPDAAPTVDMARPTTDMASTPDQAVADATVDAGQDADAGCACPGQQICQDNACAEPEACAGDIDCLADRRCYEGTCQARCTGDEDCLDGGHCDLAEQICTQERRCQRDIDCGDDICLEGICAARCTADSCPGQQRCDDGRGRCIEGEGCADNGDCLDDRVCQNELCVSPCQESADCAGAQACEAGTCAEPAACTSALDCLQARVCTDSACADPCAVTGCEGTLVCAPESGRCGEASPCADDTGCFDGRRCDAGTCVAPCQEAADCAGAQSCTNGQCAEPAECTTELDCLAERICTQGTCDARCGPDSCDGAQICDPVSGQCQEAAVCIDDTGCFAGRTCREGACIDPCMEHADCPGAMRCEEGQCSEPSPCNTSLDCLGDRQCAAGHCQDACVDGQCPGDRACVAGACLEGPTCAIAADCDGARTCLPGVGACVDACPDGVCPDGLVCDDAAPGGVALCGEPEACADDSQCLAGRACRLGRCTSIGCEAHNTCDNARCVEWQCAAAPALDCPAGWLVRDGFCEQPGRCDVQGAAPCPDACGADGRCATCDADADCPGLTHCVAGACADPEDCVGNQDCVTGHVCDGGSCVLADCAEDRLAGNHAAATAAALPSIDLNDLRACEALADWFTVGDPAGLRIVAHFDPARPAIQLALYPADAPDGPPVDVSAPAPGQAWVNAGPGDYLLRVQAPAGASGDYRLTVDSGVACAADRFERPWRNDDEARATTIGAGIHHGRLCPNDEDWFHYAGAGQISVAVQGAQATINGQAAPLDVQGPAHIRVTGAGDYTLTLTEDATPAGRCAAAPVIALGEAIDAAVSNQPDSFTPACRPMPNPDQVFRVNVPQAGRLTARLLDPDPNAGVLIYQDCVADVVACPQPADQATALVDAGAYYIVIDGAYAGRLQVDMGDGGDVCAEPPVLPLDQATAVQPGPAINLGGTCLDPMAGSAAWQFVLPTAAQVTLTLEGAGPTGAMSLRVDCADGFTEHACEGGAAPRIEDRLEAGQYIVVVQGAGQLRLRTVPDVVPPRLEEMCFPGGSPPVFAPGHLEIYRGDLSAAFNDFDGAACGGAAGTPDQVLQFTLEAPARLRAVGTADGFNPVVMLMGNECFSDPLCANGGVLNAVLQPGSYGLIVNGDGVGVGPYALDVRVSAP